MYPVRILENAITELSELDQAIAKRIAKRINWLSENFENIRPEPLTANLTGFL